MATGDYYSPLVYDYTPWHSGWGETSGTSSGPYYGVSPAFQPTKEMYNLLKTQEKEWDDEENIK